MPESSRASARLTYIDVAKGIAMLLVILGHIPVTGKNFGFWLYTFHIPLFFALSGMTFKIERNPSFFRFLKKRILSLAIPYFLLNLLLLVTETVLLRGNSTDFFKAALKGILISNRLHQYYGLWFISALFFAEILLWLAVKFTRNNRYILWGLIPVSIAVLALVFQKVQGFYYSLDLVPAAFAFVLLGYLLSGKIDSLQMNLKKAWMLLPFLAVNVAAGLLNYRIMGEKVDLYYCKIGSPVWYLVSAVAGVVFALMCAKWIGQNRILEYIGKNSLVFYVFQDAVAIPIAGKITGKVLGLFTSSPVPVIRMVLIAVIACLGLAVWTEIIRRCSPFVLGKPYAKRKPALQEENKNGITG